MTGRGELLEPADVPAVAVGAALFAAGAPAADDAVLPVTGSLARNGPVRLTTPAALLPDAVVVGVGVLADGGREHPGWPDDDAWRAAVLAVEEQAGQPVAAVVPLAAGGVLAAVHAAAATGVPCLDADAGGRGAGRLDLTLLALAGHAAAPVVADHTGTEVVAVRQAGNEAAHRIAAAVAHGMGGAAVTAYRVTARQCAALLSPAAVLGCLRAGRALARRALPATPLFSGEVADVAGGHRGTATITDGSGTRLLRLDHAGTYLVAAEGGVVRAATPDLICVLDADRGRPVPAAGLGVGTRVHVFVAPAPPRWLLQDGLAAAGPRRWGYDIDHVRPTGPTPATQSFLPETGS